MKKIIYSMMALAISATVFTSCEDVPSPYNMTFEEPNVTPTPQPTTDLNTEATAWTVAEAVQKIQAGQTTNGEAYVKGIILITRMICGAYLVIFSLVISSIL